VCVLTMSAHMRGSVTVRECKRECDDVCLVHEHTIHTCASGESRTVSEYLKRHK